MQVKVSSIFKTKSDSKLKAFVDLLFENSLIVKGFQIVEGKDGLFVGYPSEKNKEGKFYKTVHVLDKEVRDKITEVVLEEYNKN